MKKSKQRQAQILLNAMNQIDDVYLSEALLYTPVPQKKKAAILKVPSVRVLAPVAALAAILAVVMLGPLNGLLRSIGKSDAENTPQIQDESHRDLSYDSFNTLLQACTQSPSFQSISVDDLSFFDGNVRLMVQKTDTQEMFVSRPLTSNEQARLQSEFKAEGERVTSSDTVQTDYAVWVALGDGQVATPYLTSNPGNLGAAELFQYEAERIPSEHFFTLLESLI